MVMLWVIVTGLLEDNFNLTFSVALLHTDDTKVSDMKHTLLERVIGVWRQNQSSLSTGGQGGDVVHGSWRVL